jgi:hypothetical protein
MRGWNVSDPSTTDRGSERGSENFQPLNVTELGMVRRALNLPESDWRSKVSREEQRRLLATVESRDKEIYVLQNAIEEIAHRCNCLAGCDFSDDPSCTARRALNKLGRLTDA